MGAQIFKACADESRLRILGLIVMNGEMCISDLEKILDIIQQVFQFLRKDAQLLNDQKIYQTLFTNRELAVNKLQIQEWQRSNDGKNR